MKLSDWAPIIVALITFVGVVTVPGLTGNRPRPQLEALKAVRVGIEATKDEEVAAMLARAERGIASRIESRYSLSAVQERRQFGTLMVTGVATLVASVGYQYIPAGDAAIWVTARLLCWFVLLLAFAVLVTVGAFRWSEWWRNRKRRSAAPAVVDSGQPR